MIVLIPMARGQECNISICKSIMFQTLDTRVYEIKTNGVIKSRRNYSEKRRDGETASREKCRVFAESIIEAPYVVMQDYDREHLRTDNFEAMKKFLNHNPGYGAVSVSGQRHPKNKHHIDIGCVMYRYDVLTKLNFTNKYGICLCKEVTEQIRAMGLEFDYLDNIQRTREVIECVK